MTRLHQINALMEGRKAACKQFRDPVYHAFQADLFDGLIRTYEPRDEEGERFPDESTIIKARVPELLDSLREPWGKLLDLELTQDTANATAKADVVVDGVTLLKDIPVTALLRLEHHCTDFVTMMGKLPVLDADKKWTPDEGAGHWAAEPVKNRKTEKTPTVITKAPATDKHQADTEIFTKDIPIGDWTNIKISGKITAERKRELILRARKLQAAVKDARERANELQVTDREAGSAIFDFLLA